MHKPLVFSILGVIAAGCGGLALGAIAPHLMIGDGRLGPISGAVNGGIVSLTYFGVPTAILGWVLGWAIDQDIKGEYSEERNGTATHS